MLIYLMQHGQALSEDEDPDRPLSDRGRLCVQRGARAMRRMGILVDVVIASPKTRSRQTAEIVARELGYPLGSIMETAAVKPSAEPDAVEEYIDQFKRESSVFIAGHLPSLPKLASHLLAGGPAAAIDFRNGGLCCIEIDDLHTTNGILKFYLTPEQLALIAPD